MITYCPRCGGLSPAETTNPYVRTNPTCRECALALDVVPVMLAPSGDEISYGLDEWPAADRADVTDGLRSSNIPYRWEASYVLAVPLAVEKSVDALLDEVESHATTTVGAEPEEVDAGADEGADGGPEAQAAMADLFVAADRLQHVPFDVGAAGQFTVAASAVRELLPPYGIDRTVWRKIREAGAAVLAELQTGVDSDVVAEHAHTLRDLLREFV